MQAGRVSVRWLRRTPLTLLLVALLVVGATGAFPIELRHNGLVRLDLGTLSPLSLLTSLGTAQSPLTYLISTGALLTCGLVAEGRLGSRRYALVLVSVHVMALLVATIHADLVAPLLPRWSRALTQTWLGGPGSASLGALLASSAGMPMLWRRRVRAGALAFVITAVLYDGDAGGVVTFWAALIGLAAGLALRQRQACTAPVPKVSEARLLVAIVVACAALGPVVAAFSAAAPPLTSIGSLLHVAPPTAEDVAASCRQQSAPVCSFAHLEQREGLGGVLMACVPSFVLLAIASGLVRGRRSAWLASLNASGLMACVSLVVFVGAPLLTSRGRAWGSGAPPGEWLPERVGRMITEHALPCLVPLVVLVLLVFTRHLFEVRAPAAHYRRLAGRSLGTVLACAAAYVALGLAIGDAYSPSANAASLFHDLLVRVLPLDLVGPDHLDLLPVGTMAVLLFDWVGPFTWAAVLLLAAQTLRADVEHGRAEPERLGALLAGSSGGPLSWMASWRGNHHWFSKDGASAIGYRLERGVALTVGDPIGPAANHLVVLREFAEHCDEMGWTPCFYSTTREFATLARTGGWHSLQIAEETRLPLGAIAFTGKRFQDVRTAMNHATREGMRVEWTHLAGCPEHLAAQVRSISQDWVAERDLPELGFTLGGLDEMLDPAVRCQLVVDADETVHAVASWLPIHQQGAVVGWTLDVLRRRSNGFRAAIELLIAQAALDFQSEGYAVMSLSGAPLARIERSTTDATGPSMFAQPLDRLLQLFGRSLEPVYGFRSLLRFKAKFQPEFRPMFLVYPDPTNLPAIGQAVARAYLPDADRADWWRLASRLTLARRPFGRESRQAGRSPSPRGTGQLRLRA